MMRVFILITIWSSVNAFSGISSSKFCKKNALRMEIFEGNPIGKAIWDFVWKLPIMKPGIPGTSPTTFGDAAIVLRKNIEQQYGDEPSADGAPLAVGEIDGLLTGSLFLGLKDYYHKVSVCYFRYRSRYNLLSLVWLCL